ncbi:hypothetical protein L228DRAFT_257502 [Xylona heveae TC161]|uniref:Uncharacterized protein n=1 Tax=Xylona heveae (strain CBS 132557 / TC161) TaxID=1328760 RepID=A0A165JB15_XYLHT|nr:hypothetical protein L228DRAFT_257502 [Xylona heveae TC161]KZF25994.1 hypothetical protein L228DRAFT_257502 [Xylona heveae TC161]
MPNLTDDRWLWLGLGVLSFFAIRAVSSQLGIVQRLTGVSSEQRPPHVICQDTEDGNFEGFPNGFFLLTISALNLDTLQKLTEGSSYDLRGAALKIICERAVRSPSFDQLLDDLAGPGPELRDRALTALKFLCESPVRSQITTLATFTALITCLCNLLPHPAPTPANPRSPTERAAMSVLVRLLPQNTSDAIRAGLVKRWLVKYPLGHTEGQKRLAIQQLKTWSTDDFLLSEIICMIDNTPEGRKQMRQAGLMGSAMGEDEDVIDTWMIGGEDTAGDAVSISLARSNRRVREESAEEQALRRRRREAMVLSEGGRPLGREDIIQREDIATSDEVERQLESLMEEVNREDEGLA